MRSSTDKVKALNNICRAGNTTCRKRLMHDDMNEPLHGDPNVFLLSFRA
jgi:hypothetical protein